MSAEPARTAVIVGGGFSGALLGLKLHRARSGWKIIIVEQKPRAGGGVAYGACGPDQLLNAPVARMDVGLSPSFSAWLGVRRGELADALAESGGDLNAAFVPRRLFGDYLAERVAEATGLTCVRGEAVRLLGGARGVRLGDGREVRGDIVVLAVGNLPPQSPTGLPAEICNSGLFIPDPWASGAFDRVTPDEPVLLIGAGLTMVDTALRLTRECRRGQILAMSRHGLQPRVHRAGGTWPSFLNDHLGAPPLALLRRVRTEVARADADGVPWQRVIDAIRPVAASIWKAWGKPQRQQFLRHLRPHWEVFRHRLAPRIGATLDDLMAEGRLDLLAGRITALRIDGGMIEATIALRGGGARIFRAGHVVNCTGPGNGFDGAVPPLIADLRTRGLASRDALGLGLASDDCAVLDASGRPSNWLFALGPLTRPGWWEITAAPEINQQIDRLVAHLATEVPTPRIAEFVTMGEGI